MKKNLSYSILVEAKFIKLYYLIFQLKNVLNPFHFLLLIQFRVIVGLEPIPSCYWARLRVHPGQVVKLSQANTERQITICIYGQFRTPR